MIRAAILPVEALHHPNELVTAAVRCWRAARDERTPVQQCLYAALNPLDCGMLSPVFDSLMTLCEAALGRRIVVGGMATSNDERLLLGLLDGSTLRCDAIICGDEIASALDCAICSTRIMMALTADAAPESQTPASPFSRSGEPPAIRCRASGHRGEQHDQRSSP